MVLAQSPGTFTRTGNLTTARQFHTATLPPNRKGPYNRWQLRSASPLLSGQRGAVTILSETFTATGEMTTSRCSHTATLLPDGKVLIAGGDSNVNALAALPRPARSVRSFQGDFHRYGGDDHGEVVHTATLHHNGRVLIARGQSKPGRWQRRVVRSLTGTFAATAEMTTPGSHRAILLSNARYCSKALRVGDNDRPSATNSMIPIPALSAPREGRHIQTCFGDDEFAHERQVLVTSEYSCDASEFAEVYDPSAEHPLLREYDQAAGYSTATLLPDEGC